MLAWVRPDPHQDFESEASTLLADLRVDIGGRGGHLDGDDFKNREIWNGSWTRKGKPRGLHKRTLAGPDAWSTKCVWCEQLRDLRRELDVEHYRPKARVTEWEGTPPIVSDEPPAEKSVGAGYWWLAFAWSNYALSCKTCNQGWKRNLFPVQGLRALCVEGVEQTEAPLLLDPASAFETRDHFRWLVDGIMEPVSAEGYATIVACGLNRRPLQVRRGKVLRETSSTLRDLRCALMASRTSDARSALQRLGELGSRSREFTGMVRWAVETFVGYRWDEIEGLPA